MKNSLLIIFILGLISCGPKEKTTINVGSLKNSANIVDNQFSPSDSVYTSVRKEIDTRYASEFNHKAFAADVHVYKVYVSGIDIHINTSSTLWLALSNDLISELYIEGDSITIESKINFSNTKLSIITKKLKVLPGSSIDLTPGEYTVNLDAVSVDGGPGLPGPEFNVLAENIEIQSQEPVFISKGGPGQNAGPGQDGTAGSVVAVLPNSNPDEIGMEQYDYSAINWCWGETPFGRWKFECGRSEVHWGARGTFTWPSDGGNATIAGAPGPGGQGGFVYIQTQSSNVSLEQFINVNPGLNGPKGKNYAGGAPGIPTVAHIMRVRDNGSDHATWWDDTHTAKAGNEAIAPQTPRTTNTAGQIKIDTSGQIAQFKPSYFEKKLQWIRDLYIGGDGNAVSKELDETLNRLDSSIPSDTFDVRWANLQGKLQTLRVYLSLQRNYFGKEQSEAPFYNLDIDIEHFKALIQSSMQIIYLENILNDETINRQQKVDLLKQWTAQAKADIEKSVRNQAGNRLINEGLSIKMQNLAKQQKAFEEQIIQVQKELEQAAKSNVNFAKTLKESAQNFKVLLTLAKVFPAGQPALAAAASLVEKVSQSPKDGSVVDWIEYASQANEAFEKYDKIESSSTMIDDLEDYAAKLKTEGKSDDEIKQDLKDLYKETKPFYEALKKQQDIIKKSAVSNSEIDAEFKRLLGTDPLYLDLVNRVKAIQTARTQIAIQLSANANEYQEILHKLTASIILQAQSANLLVESSDTLNPEFMSLMSHLSMDAQDTLLYYYNAIEKSYEYITLEPAQAQLHLGYVVAKVREILRNRPFNEKLGALTQTYSMAADTLIQELNKYLETKNKPSIVHVATVDYAMNQKEVNELNNGETHILLNENLFPNEKNLRITNIEILEPNLKGRSHSDIPNDPVNGSMIKFKVILDDNGIIKDFANKPHYYTYRGYDQLYTWMARTKLNKGFLLTKFVHEQNPVDHSITQWLALILGKNATDLADSSLFASHAALTGLRIQTEKFGQGQNYDIKGLQIKITYSFYETAN